ncbi:hypothetical protein BAUCODRAFT_123697 [Baudoinia panamericana UAMH 10762]|uniref:Uncharacterized protein n=1 Tax=Baudoinia panamericana (strain UAMH 10762) TaxID=717646 RepID=M2N8S1_BAUPA|nr:uncharacterized protein BAUCODRAFT_123697 [Baudoinia panamericana UAMH 10762]EMC95235.1 hypothetical protein BAUCODRAFT_123697 [Baudoinia panamericana UAMH 10762]
MEQSFSVAYSRTNTPRLARRPSLAQRLGYSLFPAAEPTPPPTPSVTRKLSRDHLIGSTPSTKRSFSFSSRDRKHALSGPYRASRQTPAATVRFIQRKRSQTDPELMFMLKEMPVDTPNTPSASIPHPAAISSPNEEFEQAKVGTNSDQEVYIVSCPLTPSNLQTCERVSPPWPNEGPAASAPELHGPRVTEPSSDKAQRPPTSAFSRAGLQDSGLKSVVESAAIPKQGPPPPPKSPRLRLRDASDLSQSLREESSSSGGSSMRANMATVLPRATPYVVKGSVSVQKCNLFGERRRHGVEELRKAASSFSPPSSRFSVLATQHPVSREEVSGGTPLLPADINLRQQPANAVIVKGDAQPGKRNRDLYSAQAKKTTDDPSPAGHRTMPQPATHADRDKPIPDLPSRPSDCKSRTQDDSLETLTSLSSQTEALHRRYAVLRFERQRMSAAMVANLKEHCERNNANALLEQHLFLAAINSSIDICFAKLMSLECRKEAAMNALAAASPRGHSNGGRASPAATARPYPNNPGCSTMDVAVATARGSSLVAKVRKDSTLSVCEYPESRDDQVRGDQTGCGAAEKHASIQDKRVFSTSRLIQTHPSPSTDSEEEHPRRPRIKGAKAAKILGLEDASGAGGGRHHHVTLPLPFPAPNVPLPKPPSVE